MDQKYNPINLSNYEFIHEEDTEKIHNLIKLCESQMMEIMKLDKNLLNEKGTTRNVSKRI